LSQILHPFAQFIDAQVRKWSAVAKAANITIN